MKKLLLLLMVGSVGGVLAVNRDAAQALLKRYDALRQEYLQANKIAEDAMFRFSEALPDLFWVDVGLDDPAVKDELDKLSAALDHAQQAAWSNYTSITYSPVARGLRDRLAELAR